MGESKNRRIIITLSVIYQSTLEVNTLMTR